jgi:hypothetical protein
METMTFVALGCSTSVAVGEVGPKRECRCRSTGLVVGGVEFSFVTGRGCIDLRLEATLLLGFIWNDFRDMALRRGSDSTVGKKPSLKGDCGAGDESREVLRVPGPDTDVAADM